LRDLGAVELQIRVEDGHTLFAELGVCGWRDWRRLADHALEVFAVVHDGGDVGAGARDLERGLRARVISGRDSGLLASKQL